MDDNLLDLNTSKDESPNSKPRNRFTPIFIFLIVVIIVMSITIGILSVYAFNSHSESICTSTEADDSDSDYSNSGDSDDSNSGDPDSGDSDDSNSQSYCNSIECIQSAATIKTSMDLNYNPCDDFYKFVCNNFENVNMGHKIPRNSYSNFAKTAYRLNDVIKKLIGKPLKEKDSQPIQMVKDFYNACNDYGIRQKLGLSVMDKYLNQSNLPKIPAIFTLPEEDWNNYSFNWVKTSVAMKKTFGIDLFVNVKFEKDAIRFQAAPEGPVIQPLVNPAIIFSVFEQMNLPPMAEDFKRTVVVLINKVLEGRKIEHFNKVLDMVSDKLWNMTQEAHKVNIKYYEHGNNKELKMKLKHFQNLTDKNLIKNGLSKKPDEDWENYVTMLYKALSGKSKKFTNNKITYWSHELDYITNIPVYLSKIPDVMLEMYAWWRAIDLMILYTTQETSLELNNALFSYIPTESECVDLAVKHFNPVLAFGLITKDFIQNTKPKVTHFVQNIIKAFKERIGNLNWINEEIQEVFINKLDEMQIFVGAPDSITNEAIIMSQYSRFHMEPYSHMDNMMQIVKNSVLDQFESAISGKKSDSDKNVFSSYGDINEVNIRFEASTNSIKILWANINPPFYNLGLPSLQYGALGTMIGHGIISGLTLAIAEHFDDDTSNEKAKCFVEQYENFTVRAYGKDHKENGTSTLLANIADNGGTQIAFYALKKYLESNPIDEYKLPGFEEYTNEQLFFLAQAHMWCRCGEQEVENLILSMIGDYSLNKFRLNGIMQNMPEFAEAFDCPLGSNMNPKRERCDMWLIN